MRPLSIGGNMLYDLSKGVTPKCKLSKKLTVFKPVDVVILRRIPYSFEEHEDDIMPGSIAQISMEPNGVVSLGYFEPQGSGTVYAIVGAEVVEGIDFRFREDE